MALGAMFVYPHLLSRNRYRVEMITKSGRGNWKRIKKNKVDKKEKGQLERGKERKKD
jgi:hypothetical protein